jgi:hypothetical protein
MTDFWGCCGARKPGHKEGCTDPRREPDTTAATDDLIERLQRMGERTTRHDYDIGDYWNAVGEAAAALREQKVEIARLKPATERRPPGAE